MFARGIENKYWLKWIKNVLTWSSLIKTGFSMQNTITRVNKILSQQ